MIVLCSFETLQFEDYGKGAFNYFDPEERRERRRTVFPEECRKKFELEARLVGTIAAGTTGRYVQEL